MKSSHRGFVGLFVLIVVAILIVGGYVYVQNKKPSTTAPIDTSAPAQQTGVSSGWKTYHSDKHGFTFKYPAEYKTPVLNPYTEGSEGGDNIGVNDSQDSPAFMLIVGEMLNGNYCYLGLCEGVTLKTATLNGVQWDLLDISKCVGGCEAIGSLYRTVHDANRYYFVFWRGGKSVPEDVLNTFNWQ